jgi:uncharacterized protein YdhG (YjbR/CyaY superfamily)
MPKFATVDEYVAAQPAPVQELLATVRRIVAEEVPGVTESIRYDMPVFGSGDSYLVHVAAWKQHLGLYPVPVFDAALEAEIAPLRAAKDTVRLVYELPFPEDVFRRILRELLARKRG